jgi:hypothetical protein
MLCVLLDAELTPGTQLTSFGTIVQILTLQALAAAAKELRCQQLLADSPQLICFNSAKVQILTCVSAQLLLASL